VHLARFAEERKPGCLAPLGRKGCVSQSTASTTGKNVGLTGGYEIDDDIPIDIGDNRATRDFHDDIVGIGSVAIRALPGFTVACPSMRMTVKIEERRNRWVDHGDDITASSTIAAIRTTKWFELLAMNRGAAITAVATLRMDHSAIHEGTHSALISRFDGPGGGDLPVR